MALSAVGGCIGNVIIKASAQELNMRMPKFVTIRLGQEALQCQTYSMSLLLRKCPSGTKSRQSRRAFVVRSMTGEPMSEGFSENDDMFVQASIVEAVEVKSGADGFMMKMMDGRYLRCAHNNSEGSKLPSYPSQPAIVLKMEDASNLMLPILVAELPSKMLMEAMCNVPTSRPTVYQVIRDMVEMMGYEVKLVRITHRVCEAYHARIYLSKALGDSDTIISLDLKPSDAINLAARCKVPVQVSKALVAGDGVQVVANAVKPLYAHARGRTHTDCDEVVSDDCQVAEEFDMYKNMNIAIAEERYVDAAKIRDQLGLRKKTAAE